MAKTKMHELTELGQSLWLDYIDRPLLETGKLKEMIENGLRGMTSNPSIFNSAIGSSNDYDDKIRTLRAQGKTTFEIYDDLTIRDIQQAADHFADLYKRSNRLDGYVSLEINPQIANEVDAQIKEGKRLFAKVNRPNVMIKVPSTNAGFPVIEELIASGINVNVTLIFSLKQYEQSFNAYWQGLNRLVKTTSDLSGVRSVASVFVSRIDTDIDKLLDGLTAKETNADKKNQLIQLRGQAAVANSRLIYGRWQELMQSPQVKTLQAKGANNQRILWGSTGTKDPKYSDIKYVTELIAPETVNTLPEKTLMAFVDHGHAKNAFDSNCEAALAIIKALAGFGIDVNVICRDLLEKGVKSFDDAFVQLFDSIEKKAKQLSLIK